MMLAAIFLPLQIPNIAPKLEKAWIYAVEIKSHGLNMVFHDRFEIQLRVEASGDATWTKMVSAKRPDSFTYSGLVSGSTSVMYIEQGGILSSVLMNMENQRLSRLAKPLPDSGLVTTFLGGKSAKLQVLSSNSVALAGNRHKAWWSARIDSAYGTYTVTVDRLLDREFMPICADICIWTTQDSYITIRMMRKSMVTDKRQNRTKQPPRASA